MGNILETVTDDWLGLDPNGGGIYDVPVIGDIIDDQLGLDPGQSPIEHLLEIAGWATLGTVAAGAAGVGPLAGTVEAIKAGAPLSEILPSWGSLTGAQQTAAATEIAAASGGAITGPELLHAANTGSQVAGAINTGASIIGSGSPNAGNTSWLNTLSNVAQAAGSIAGAVGAGAEVYDAITGGGAEADRELVRGSVADVAPLTDLQREGISSQVTAARDPRAQQAAGLLYDAQQRGSGALGTGLNTLEGIATGSDPYTQRLASQAAGAADLSASRAGVLGGARSERAAQTAAADVIAKRQQSAANTLASRGQGLLGQGQQALSLSTEPGSILSKAGALEQQQQQNVLNQEAARNAALVKAGLREPTTAERIGQVAGGLEALPTAIDQGRQAYETVSGLFGQGGKVKKKGLLDTFR